MDKNDMKSSFRRGVVRILDKAHLKEAANQLLVAAVVSARSVRGTDAKFAHDYLTNVATPKLQIGAGPYARNGWLNTNYHPVPAGTMFLNASKRFPFPDDSFRYAHSEHVIEHLCQADGENLLAEAFRVLRPGGRIRVATPNLATLTALLANDLTPGQLRYVEEASSINNLPCSAGAVFNNAVRAWGHRFLYTEAMLFDALAKAGFVDIEAFEIGKSNVDDLRDLEHPDRQPDGYIVAFETLTVEGGKPGLR